METGLSSDSTPPGWYAWKTTVVGLWVVLLAGFGMGLVEEGFLQLRHSVSLAGAGAYLAWTLQFVLAFGVVAIGSTGAYLRLRDLDASFTVVAPHGEDARLLGALAVLVGVVFACAAAVAALAPVSVAGLTVVYSIAGPAPIASLENWTSLIGGTLFLAVLSLVALGPGIAALTHGVLQNTLREVAGPLPAVWATAALFGLWQAFGDTAGLALGVEPLGSFLLVGGFVAGTGYAYERSRNLLLPMVAYGLLAALGSLFAALPTMLDLYAEFGTTLP